MTVNPNYKGDKSFGKFTSNCIGDPYVDPNQYFLRKSAPGDLGTGVSNGIRSKSNMIGGAANHGKPFGPSGSHKTVKNSEFEHHHNGPPPRPKIENKKGFSTTSKPELFAKKTEYKEDPFERKQDIERDEYAKNNSKILHRDQPFSTVVRQRGTFYPNFQTYGTSIAFPDKKPEAQKAPLYGPFKIGDPMHTGHNKTIGGHGRTTEDQYIEEVEEDQVKYQKNVKRPIWKDPTHQLTMMNSTVANNIRNINKERALIFGS